MINYFRLLCATNIRFHLLFREIIKTKKHEQTVIFKSDILTGKIKRARSISFLTNALHPKRSKAVIYIFTLINVGLFFSIYSDFGFYTVRPVRLDRSAKAFLHWPAELLASSSDTTGRAFRKSKTTLAGAPMVPEHEHLRLPLSLPGKLNRTWKP